MSEIIYLDYAASAPLKSVALEAMLPWLESGHAGNAHSRHHTFGQKAGRAVQAARGQLAQQIGAGADEIVFTSGATEANNLVAAGLRRHLQRTGKTHIITSEVEHKSVLEAFQALREYGFEIEALPVKSCGMLEARTIERALRPETGLITVQAVNNELGTIQPLPEIAAVAKSQDILLHCDAAQALGKIEFDVDRLGIDFASLSSHKMGGPQGIGALYAKAEQRPLLQPLLRGGGQEDGLRSGTLPVALCAGFGAASLSLETDWFRLQNMRKDFIRRLEAISPVIHGHTDPVWNVPGILNLRFPGIDNEALVMALPDLAFGIGSACSSHGDALSHVIIATTNSELSASEAIRLSFGPGTTEQELERAAAMIVAAVTEIRSLGGSHENRVRR